MLVEKLILAKLKASMTYGSIKSLSEMEYLTASCFIPLAKNEEEMIEILRLNPWDLVAFENPRNLSPSQISRILKSTGLSSIARILIEDNSNCYSPNINKSA